MRFLSLQFLALHLNFSWISFLCWSKLGGGIEGNRYRLFLGSTVAFKTLEAWDSELMVWSRAPLSLTLSQDVSDVCEQFPSMAVLVHIISKRVLILSKQSVTGLVMSAETKVLLSVVCFTSSVWSGFCTLCTCAHADTDDGECSQCVCSRANTDTNVCTSKLCTKDTGRLWTNLAMSLSNFQCTVICICTYNRSSPVYHYWYLDTVWVPFSAPCERLHTLSEASLGTWSFLFSLHDHTTVLFITEELLK